MAVAWGERFRQVDAHHRIHDRILEVFPFAIGDACQFVPMGPLVVDLLASEGAVAQLVFARCGFGYASGRAFGKTILV